LHSNSLEQVPERLISIATQQGLNEATLSRLVVSAFDWVISLSSTTGSRAVSGIGKFQIVNDKLIVVSQLRTRKLQLA
jgi:Flp pilus assembly CpaF family ATPase